MAKAKARKKAASATAKRIAECGDAVVKSGRRRGQAKKGYYFDGKSFCPKKAQPKTAKLRTRKISRAARGVKVGTAAEWAKAHRASRAEVDHVHHNFDGLGRAHRRRRRRRRR